MPFSLRRYQTVNRFCLNPVSYHGYGAIESVPAEIKGHRFKKGLICTDADLVKFKVIDNITKLLDKEGLGYAVYDHIKPNPTIENVLEGVEGYEKMSQEEYREAAIKAVSKLSEDVEIPTSLKGIVKEEDLDFLADSAMADACMGGNPRTPTKEEVITLYKSLM